MPTSPRSHRSTSPPVSFVISSVAFGVLHGRWLAGILAGMLYALAQYRRGEISDAIVAHAVTQRPAGGLCSGSWANGPSGERDLRYCGAIDVGHQAAERVDQPSETFHVQTELSPRPLGAPNQ